VTVTFFVVCVKSPGRRRLGRSGMGIRGFGPSAAQRGFNDDSFRKKVLLKGIPRGAWYPYDQTEK
jgi:hypothetical protein